MKCPHCRREISPRFNLARMSEASQAVARKVMALKPGEVLSPIDFPNNKRAGMTLAYLYRQGHVQRISYGKYVKA